MSKIAEKKALEAYPKDKLTAVESVNRTKRFGYIQGYDQAMQEIKQFVEELIKHEEKEWGEHNVDFGLYSILGHIVKIEEISKIAESEIKNTNCSPILYGTIPYNKRQTIIKELESLYNKLGIDNEFSTPDYLLAEYTLNCLIAYGNAMNKNKEKSYIKSTFDETININHE